MKLEEAKEILNKAEKHELRDHAFGDTEIVWMVGDESVGDGYFGGRNSGISVMGADGEWHEFEGKDAQELRHCGASSNVARNDSTGPEEYAEGVTMPGLTIEGVRKELAGESE